MPNQLNPQGHVNPDLWGYEESLNYFRLVMRACAARVNLQTDDEKAVRCVNLHDCCYGAAGREYGSVIYGWNEHFSRQSSALIH
jgi:hypothetical protein